MVCLQSYHIDILSFDIAVFIVIKLFYNNCEVCGDCFTVYLGRYEIMGMAEGKSSTYIDIIKEFYNKAKFTTKWSFYVADII